MLEHQLPFWPYNCYLAIASHNRVVACASTPEEALSRGTARGFTVVVAHAKNVVLSGLELGVKEDLLKQDCSHPCPRCKRSVTPTSICANCAADLYEKGEPTPDPRGVWVRAQDVLEGRHKGGDSSTYMEPQVDHLGLLRVVGMEEGRRIEQEWDAEHTKVVRLYVLPGSEYRRLTLMSPLGGEFTVTVNMADWEKFVEPLLHSRSKEAQDLVDTAMPMFHSA